jgi:hypothetical protein
MIFHSRAAQAITLVTGSALALVIAAPSDHAQAQGKLDASYTISFARIRVGEQDLLRVRSAWNDCQTSRDRNAIYGYLSAVFDLVAWWAAEGRAISRARRALQLQGVDVPSADEPFAAIILATADREKVDKRTRSKWSRVMRYAAEYKPSSEPLAAFVQRKGGINKCAARFTLTRCLGRYARGQH